MKEVGVGHQSHDQIDSVSFLDIGLNDSASRRGTPKRGLQRLGSEEVSGLVSCGEAEVAAFEVW